MTRLGGIKPVCSLDEALRDHDLSTRTLAEKVGCRYSTLWTYVVQVKVPSVTRCLEICEAFTALTGEPCTVETFWRLPKKAVKALAAVWLLIASTPAGTVRVDFYDGRKLMATDTEVPWLYEWQVPEDPASHFWTAKAYDEDGTARSVPLTSVPKNERTEGE